MKSLKKDRNMSILLITHNLAVVAEMADNIAVMYTGRIVEYSNTKEIFDFPSHPYTWGLLNSIPRVDKEKTDELLPAIEGVVPNPYHMPSGCKFNPRCTRVQDKCKQQEPELQELKTGHFVRCWFPLTDTNNQKGA